MGDTMINGNETFSAPYAGSDALSSIDFSKAQITNTIGTGDFDQAILNSSGHQNVFAHAEFIDITDDMVLDICVMAHEDGHGVYEVYPVDLVRQALHRINENPSLMERFHKKVGFSAETFAAASTARPDLPREKRNVLNSVRSNYDPSFSWSSCSWGPYFNRFAAEGSNKFYSVWVWERSPGIYTAMGAYGGLGQNPRLFNVGQTRDLQQAVNMAKKKLQSKQKKGYQTYSAEYMENLSNAIVQFEDGAGFSSASAPPNDIYFAEELEGSMNRLSKEEQIAFLKQIIEDNKGKVQKPYELTPGGYGFGLNGKVVSAEVYLKHLQEMASEEGSTPVQDPMELGEMANWTPMDGSEGLKRKRAESQVFALTYFLQNDVNMEDINDVTEALELYLSLSEDIAEMDASGLQKHPRYEVANRMLSDLSYRLDELQTQLPEIDVDIEMDAEYEAWRSAFTDGAAATQIHKYDRNWMQKVMNPRSRQIKSMWNDAKPSFNEELKSAEDRDPENLNLTNKLGLPNYDPYAKGGVFYEDNFLKRNFLLTWGLGMVAAFFLGKKL